MSQQPPEGWYANPEDDKTDRFWDGAAWTTRTKLKGQPEPPPTPPPPPVAASAPQQHFTPGDRPPPWAAEVVARGPAATKANRRAMRRPHWRKTTWIILAFNLLMLIWIIAALTAASDNCEGETGSALEACETGTAIGATLGIGVLVFFWFLVSMILGVIWLVTNNKKTRDCPACGIDVKKGLTACGSCGYNFAAAAVSGQYPPSAGQQPPPRS